VPGNPEHRLRVRDFRSELTVFCVFIISFVFLKPLILQGFWTTYNRSFGTHKHLYSEYRKSTTLLDVTYIVRSGSEELIYSGLLVDCDATVCKIWNGHNVMNVPGSREVLVDLTFSDTDTKFMYRESVVDTSDYSSLFDSRIVVDLKESGKDYLVTELVMLE